MDNDEMSAWWLLCLIPVLAFFIALAFCSIAANMDDKLGIR
jgi:hypothetical protein